MNDYKVSHDTFVIQRQYPVSPSKVFAAFSDPGKKRRWFAEGGHSQTESFDMDFRVGGQEHCRFRFGNDIICTNNSFYTDIVSGERIVVAYTMSIGDQRISSSQMTVEFREDGGGTSLVFTEQGAYFAQADGPAIREKGWAELLERLATELSR